MAALSSSSSSLIQSFQHDCGGDDPSLRRGAAVLGLSSIARMGCAARKGFLLARVSSHAESAVAAKHQEVPSGFTRSCRISEELQRIIGKEELPRPQVVKSVWNYIHEHNLQDPADRRSIVCNADLAQVLGVERTDMFQLSRLLSRHLTYTGPTGVSKPKPPKSPSSSRGSGLSKPFRISQALKSFLATNETEMVRSDVVKLMWDYIKEHNLQDPEDRRRVICDAKLKELLQCESLLGIGITKYLSPHFLKD
ncbi:SWI/SNF complex component SNF12 homolog [Selaginella moellendorffii]|uniref:SWI/SNF complex component SNF12 homolog n=1 Tax=Selaginella moellendorffii TaxID=88036 RepID=UPI000D1CFA24|nr:SWI/SNF complex component SNF12 homolog [Selaginella moellendorffii]|eukprot:XP_024518379.1 SWI/SNF complex component SNF12 homolog [Selaginella moellendorffii]